MNLKILYLLLLLAPASYAAPFSNEIASTSDCSYDREAMLALDEAAFDQDLDGGWRILAREPECREAAADLIREYREFHSTEQTIIYWHEAQMRAMVGDYEAAIPLMKSAYEPPEYDFFGWNLYVDATIAFLNSDKASLREAHEALVNLPYPDEEILPVAARDDLDWPMNLRFVERFIACFELSYQEAYGRCTE